MAGYKSRNSLEKRVELSGGYHAIIQKLSAPDFKVLQDIALGDAKAKQRSTSTGDDEESVQTETLVEIDLKSGTYTDELIVRGVKSWDIDDEDGTILPVRKGLDVLYNDDYSLLVKEIKALSRPPSAGEKKAGTNDLSPSSRALPATTPIPMAGRSRG